MHDEGIGYNAKEKTYFYNDGKNVIGTKYKEFETLDNLIKFITYKKFSEKNISFK